jgi:hypothetical protein
MFSLGCSSSGGPQKIFLLGISILPFHFADIPVAF